MKRKVSCITFSILIAVFLNGCFLWNPNVHQVRISSTVSDGTLTNVKIADVSFGDIETDGITEYQEVPRDTELTITYGADDTQISAITLNGYGTHSWTLTIDGTFAKMTMTIMED